MDINEKLYIANNLRQELKLIKDKLWAMGFEINLAKREDFHQLDLEIEALWNELFACIPPIENYMLDRVNLNEEVTLTQWVHNLADFSDGILLGQPYNVISPPQQIEEVKIWGRYEKWYLSEKLPDYQGDTYWFRVFKNFENWRTFTSGYLENVSWKVKQNHLELEFVWSGVYSSIRNLNIRGNRENLWEVLIIDNQISKNHISIATSSLLNAQFLLQSGQNSLTSKFRENNLILILKIPRADIDTSLRIKSTPSESNLDKMLDYMIGICSPHFLEANKRLEIELKKQFNQWQKSGRLNFDTALEQRLIALLDQLSKTREIFS